MPYRGAGGTRGGEGNFFIGIVMMIAVGYLLLRGIMVRPQFGLGNAMYSIGGFPVTTGLVLVPFAFGVGMIFYNSRNWIGWLLTGGSVVALVVGVIASINFTLVRMSAFDLLVIIILLVGGIGLFLRSLRGG
jgi:hypothetical protein